MRSYRRINESKHRSCVFLVATLTLAFSIYVEQVVSFPADVNRWPTFPRRNIAALARDGYLRASANGEKRSISTLAKNGQLPTFRSPYDETERNDQDDGVQEKRNLASLARLRSYANKRNVQALARDGYRVASKDHGAQDKRAQKSDEFYFPFYQNPVPPVDEFDAPMDFNELYDLEQSVNPDMFPPLSQVFKRGSDDESELEPEYYRNSLDSWYLKRGAAGLPVHGLYRPVYAEPSDRNKRYVLSMPDVVDNNGFDDAENRDNGNEDKRSVDADDEIVGGFEKRHIGSLARLGLLPTFRFTGGRYSRSGRARLIFANQEMYRKHSPNENFGIRQHFIGAEAEPSSDSDDANIPPSTVLTHSHPTRRFLNRPLTNDLPLPDSAPAPPLPPPSPRYIEAFMRNHWPLQVQSPARQYYFRSSKVPYRTDKRFLVIPAVDNILLRKAGNRNSSLPSRRKNE